MATLPNSTPIHAGPPRAVAPVAFTTANTNRDGTGTIADVVSNVSPLGLQGCLVRRISANATGTTTAGVLRFYLWDGTNSRLIREVLVTAITPSATVKAWSFQSVTGEADIANGFWNCNLEIPPGYKLQVSTHNAEAFVATPWVADF